MKNFYGLSEILLDFIRDSANFISLNRSSPSSGANLNGLTNLF